MNIYERPSLALLTDLYELTMAQGYYLHNRDQEAVFDMFFRKQPFGGGYSVFAGLEPLVTALLNFRFEKSDIEYLGRRRLFKPEFLAFLSDFRFRGSIFAMEEGEIVFPDEPLVRVHANIIEAQLIESFVLNTINFQTLIATKAARVVEAAQGRAVAEFGLRRAHGADGALSATRAAYIGGVTSTSNTLAGRLFGIPVSGTMAHSWVMSFDSELASFENYARLYPRNTILLVDTYDTLAQGIPGAIKVLTKLKQQGVARFGIRLDSGDLAFLSKRARAMLDRAGVKEAKIVASNELDEQAIEGLLRKKAPIDIFGVGTKLVTAYGDPYLSGVYKLVAKKVKGNFVPVLKLSDDPDKMTNPNVKNVLRAYDEGNIMVGDIVFLEEQRKEMERGTPGSKPSRMGRSRPARSSVLLRPIVRGGRPSYRFPGLAAIRDKVSANMNSLPPACKRLRSPLRYPVCVSRKLEELKRKLMEAHRMHGSGTAAA